MTDAEPQFGSELRRLRAAAGLSLADLADRIHYSKGYLSKLETGFAQPNHTVANLCDNELDTGGVLVGMVARNRRKRAKPKATLVRPVGLPPSDAYFTGRADSAAEVRSVLLGVEPGAATVCAIDGMAGVGKTALAMHVAHEVDSWFPDGCLFLDLGGHTPDTMAVSSSDALDRFLRLLGVPAETIPPDMGDRAALYRGCLRGLRLLVVLDNAINAQQIRPLLPGERTCRVLVTSRNRLVALDDAHHVSLDVLGPAEAATLFGAVAGTGRLGHEPDSAHRVATTVARCGHLPLAVRIAAARYRADPTQSLAAFTERLGAAATVLRELDDGERSVTAAFQLSYQALPDDQRRLLGLLALTPATDADGHAAAALAGADIADTRRLLDRLLDVHLVDQHVAGRYRSHDLVRAFAAQVATRDIAEPDRTGALLRLVDHELHALVAADMLLEPGRYRPDVTFEHLPPSRREFTDVAAATAWLDVEWPNLVALCRRASAAGWHQRCWQLAYMLRSYAFLAKQWDAWIETQGLALAAARVSGDLWAQGVTLNSLGIALVDRGDIDAARPYYEEALNVFSDLGDDHGVASAVANLGWADHYAGRNDAALDRLRTALVLYRREDRRHNIAITLRGIALTEADLGAYADAVVHATEALAILDVLGSRLSVAMALNCLGWAHFRSGHHDEAAAAYRRALVAGEQAASRHEMARAETGLGNVAAAQDRLAEAGRYWQRAEERGIELNTTTVAESRTRVTVGGS